MNQDSSSNKNFNLVSNRQISQKYDFQAINKNDINDQAKKHQTKNMKQKLKIIRTLLGLQNQNQSIKKQNQIKIFEKTKYMQQIKQEKQANLKQFVSYMSKKSQIRQDFQDNSNFRQNFYQKSLQQQQNASLKYLNSFFPQRMLDNRRNIKSKKYLISLTPQPQKQRFSIISNYHAQNQQTLQRQQQKIKSIEKRSLNQSRNEQKSLSIDINKIKLQNSNKKTFKFDTQKKIDKNQDSLILLSQHKSKNISSPFSLYSDSNESPYRGKNYNKQLAVSIKYKKIAAQNHKKSIESREKDIKNFSPIVTPYIPIIKKRL